MSKIYSLDLRKGTHIADIGVDQPTISTPTSFEFAKSEKGICEQRLVASGSFQLGATLPTIIKPANDFTVICFFRTPNDITTQTIFIGSGDAIGDRYSFSVQAGQIRFSELGGGQASSATIEPNTWYCGVFSNVGGVHTMYLNGVLQIGSTGSTSHYAGTTTTLFGAGSGSSLPFYGQIALFEVWDEVINAKQIAAYQKMFNNSRPSTRAVKDNLDYPALKPHDLSHLVDARVGNPDADPVTNLITDGTFPSADNWTLLSEWTISGGAAIYDATGSGYIKQGGRSYKAGQKYLLTYTITQLEAGDASLFFATGLGVATQLFAEYPITYVGRTTGTYREIVTCINDSDEEFGMYATVTDEFTLTNLSLVEWSGEELVPDADVGFVANDVAKWTAYSNNTKEQVGNAVKINYVDNSLGASLLIRSLTGTAFTDMDSGKYKFVFKMKATSGTPSIMIYDGAGYNNAGTITAGADFEIFTWEQTQTAYPIIRFASIIDDVSIEILSVKKVTGLVAAYNMIPNDGTLVDISGEGNDGTIVDCFESKNGIVFSDSHDLSKIDCGFTDHVMTGKATSLAFRFKKYNAGRIVTLRSSVIANGMLTVDANLRVSYYNGSYNANPTDLDNSLQDGVWYNAVIIYDEPNDITTVYVNGVKVSTGSGANMSPGNPFIFGQRSTGLTVLTGELADFNVFNYAFSEQESLAYHQQWADQVKFKGILTDDHAVGDSI